MKKLPPIEELREVFDYDEVTGLITWKINKGPRIKAGDEAGNKHVTGYRHIMYKREMYKAARIAYALHHGTDPYPYEVDHINRIKDDNSANNLRLATPSSNGHNKGIYSNNTSNQRGVSYNKREKKWCAYITLNRKRIHLGWYKTFEEATDARLKAEIEMLQSVTTP